MGSPAHMDTDKKDVRHDTYIVATTCIQHDCMGVIPCDMGAKHALHWPLASAHVGRTGRYLTCL